MFVSLVETDRWVSKAVDSGCIQSRYFSPHSLKMFKEKLSENTVKSSFPIFHNNIVSINRNLENVELLLGELDFHFDIIGISEKKITNSNESNAHPSIPGYVFEHVPTPLAPGQSGPEALASLLINL